MRALTVMVLACALVTIYVIFANAVTSPELTARYNTRQQQITARALAEQQTRQAQAQAQAEISQRWAQTWETWGMWGTGGMAVAVVAGVGGYAVVQWQRERSRRHVATEVYSTQRHLISAHRDVALAYIATSGDPGAYRGMLEGIEGVFLPSVGEFVPLDVCRRELQANRLLTMRIDTEVT